MRFHCRTLSLALTIAAISCGSTRADATSDTAGIRTRLHAFFFVPGSPDNEPPPAIGPIVVRGRFAVANVEGPVEGRRMRGQILLERYAFGWQTIDLEDRLASCVLSHYGVEQPAIEALLARAPEAEASRAAERCPDGETQPTRPPTRDESAIQALMAGQLPHALSTVYVDGIYAVAPWYGSGGGTALFEKSRGTAWVQRTGGGGYVRPDDMIVYGHFTPQAAATLFAKIDRGAPKRFDSVRFVQDYERTHPAVH